MYRGGTVQAEPDGALTNIQLRLIRMMVEDGGVLRWFEDGKRGHGGCGHTGVRGGKVRRDTLNRLRRLGMIRRDDAVLSAEQKDMGVCGFVLTARGKKAVGR